MLPPDNYRRKMMLTPLSEDTQDKRQASGYPLQYIRNTLQLNQGHGDLVRLVNSLRWTPPIEVGPC